MEISIDVTSSEKICIPASLYHDSGWRWIFAGSGIRAFESFGLSIGRVDFVSVGDEGSRERIVIFPG